MLVISRMDPADALAILGEEDPPESEADCSEQGLVAFAAEEDDDLVALAVAESHPREVHVVDLEGDLEACRVLLSWLMRLAGERCVSVSCSAERGDLRGMLEGAGFSQLYRYEDQEGLSYLYHRVALA